MKKAPGWKTLGTAVTAALTLGIGNSTTDTSQQTQRPVFNQQPTQTERVQPRTTTSDTDSTTKGTPQATAQGHTTPSDSARKAYSTADSLEEQVQRTDSINATTPSVDFVPGDQPSQKQSPASTTNPPTDTVFVDNTTYSEPGNDETNTITRVNDNTAYLTITTQDDSTIVEGFPANIQTNESLNTSQGRRALRNAGWTPTNTTASSQNTIDFTEDPNDDKTTPQAPSANITFTQHDADLDSLYNESTTRPFHFEGADDNHVTQAVTAQQGDTDQHYVLTGPTQNPNTPSNRVADNLTDIYGSLLGPIAGADNDVGTIDSPAEAQAQNWLKESVATHLAYVKAQAEDKETVQPTITPDEITTEFNKYGFLTNISIDDSETTDRELASRHPGVLYNTDTDEAEPSIFLSGGQQPSEPTNGIVRTDPAAPTYESMKDNPTSLEQAIEAGQAKSKIIVNDLRPDTYVESVYAETDPVHAVSVGPDYNATQGIGGTINIHHGDWEFGADVNYQDDALDQTTKIKGQTRQLGVPYSPEEGVLIPAGSYFAPLDQAQTTGEGISITPQLGYDLTDNITARVGIGATRLTETNRSNQLYIADPSERALETKNPVENSIYAGSLTDPTVTEETTIAPNGEVGITYDLNDHFTVNVEGGYDAAYDEPTYGGGVEYNIGGN